MPTSVPAYARARELTAAVTGAVAGRGTLGDADRVAAAEELWALRDHYAAEPPLGAEEITATFATMSGILGEIYDAEKAAVQRLDALLYRRYRLNQYTWTYANGAHGLPDSTSRSSRPSSSSKSARCRPVVGS